MTLTQAARGTRFLVKAAGILFSIFLIIKISTDVIQAIWPAKPHTSPLPTPTLSFGKLAPLQIDYLSLPTDQPPTVEQDLVEAELPSEPRQVKIFPITKAPYGFLAIDRAKEQAKLLNFTEEPQRASNNQLIWTGLNRNLYTDPASLNFTYQYNYQTDPSVFIPGQFLSQKAAEEYAVNIMTSKRLLGGGTFYEGARGKDLAKGDHLASLLTYQNQLLTGSNSVGQVSAVRVDFYREPIDEIPVLPPHYKESLMNLLVSAAKDDTRAGLYRQILALNYTYWVVNYQSYGTYPVITSQQAYEVFKNNPLETLVYLRPENAPFDDKVTTQSFTPVKLTVRNVFLAYYDSEAHQPYLQPIWVFLGKAQVAEGGNFEFAAYIPALSPEWMQE